jgi:hypothetical protein
MQPLHKGVSSTCPNCVVMEAPQGEKDEEEKQKVELYVCNVHGYQLDMNREGERHIW